MESQADPRPPGKRMAPELRRESILAAATAVFGERGYVGATTDQIATAAGISQAYVVRVFGSKERLFVEAGRRAAERVKADFREAIAAFPPDVTLSDKMRVLGVAYSNLIADRGTLLTLMHFASQGADETLGPLARDTYMEIYRIARDEAGMGPEAARDFLARGMLINTVMALRLPHEAADDPDVLELLDCVFEDKAGQIIALSELYTRMRDARR